VLAEHAIAMHLEEVANEARTRAAQPQSPNPPRRLVYDNLNGRKDPLGGGLSGLIFSDADDAELSLVPGGAGP